MVDTVNSAFSLRQDPYSVHNLSGTLITSPFTNFKKASEKLPEHFSSTSARKFHLEAVQLAQNFRATMESNVLPIDKQLSNIRAQRIAKKSRASLKQLFFVVGRE